MPHAPLSSDQIETHNAERLAATAAAGRYGASRHR